MKEILQDDVQNFIKGHLKTDVRTLAFQKNPFPAVAWTEVLNQIKSRQKATQKIPTWYRTDGLYYPPALSSEQSSSEATALFKSELIQNGTVIDITGGMGVDDYFLSKSNLSVHYCEIQAPVYDAAMHNFASLKASNIQGHLGDGLLFLETQTDPVDHVYIDPARRDDTQKKVFLIEDCVPNVVDHLPLFQKKCKHLWIKTSPLLDITATIHKLKFVTALYIIAVQNEVKELLWHLEWEKKIDTIPIQSVNITQEGNHSWLSSYPSTSTASYAAPQQYLYVPHAAMFKSGLFDAISQEFGMAKLHAHSHLYTSEHFIAFPGRIFEIEQVIPYQKNNFHLLKKMEANVSSRNFPDNAETLIKKHQLKNGGEKFAFYTTNLHQEKIVIIAKKAGKS